MTAQAPAAPGRLGEAIPADRLQAYLDALVRWRGERRQELDRIDAAALRAPDADSYTGDLTLLMTVWQSVVERVDALTAVWDSGRAGPQQREQMSQLIWGTGSALPGQAPSATGSRGTAPAGPGAGGLALSLVEASRLADALTATLRTRLSFDPLAADLAARLAQTRAGVERVAEALAGARPAARPDPMPDVAGLRRRLERLTAQAARGADVAGPFAVLESEVARAERDLIVGAASHRDLDADRRAARERREELEAREQQVRTLAAGAVRAVTPVPRLAVPDVELLGEVPGDRPALDAYRRRLEDVARALALAADAYGAALAERDELAGRLQAYTAKAAALGRDGEVPVRSAYDRARAALISVPTPMAQARELVAAYQRLLQPAAEGRAR